MGIFKLKSKSDPLCDELWFSYFFSVGDEVYDSDMNSEDDGQDTINLLKSKENVALKEKTGICKTSHMIVLGNV